jgi:heme oxygenase (biliverdin-IX-beta and delta-forming)
MIQQQRQAMRPPLLLQLKQETLSHHESLERHLQLLRPELNLEDYRILLESFYGFYAPWEQRAVLSLQQALPGFFDERRKTPLLERDLRFLGSDPAAIKECPSLPATDSLLALLGSLYVLEGATLGGQILSRHFARQLNLCSEGGCSFFSSYGSAVGRRWRSFCELLASYSSPDNDTVIVQSAVQTFCCLGKWLGQEAAIPC